MPRNVSEEKMLAPFLNGKSVLTLSLFDHFIAEYKKIGEIRIHPTKSMIGIANSSMRVAWITQLGKNFIHIVFPFKQAYNDNLCFQKIAQVPEDAKQFNHHLRMYYKEDINKEVMKFMKMAYDGKC